MAVPSIPVQPGAHVSGKISWFGGQQTANGSSTAKPGIAVYNEATLNGWWLVLMPNHVLGVVQQTDVGPAPWTGRKFDFSQGALAGFGYTTQNFPTDGSIQAIYLGKGTSQFEHALLPALQNLSGGNLPNIVGWAKTSFGKGPQFATTQARGSHLGPFDTGAVDTGNKPVQPGGPSTVGDTLSGIFNTAVADAKYGAVFLVAIVAGAYLILHGLTGKAKPTEQFVLIGSKLRSAPVE